MKYSKAEGEAMLAIFHDPELVRRLAERVVTLTHPVCAAEMLETCDSGIPIYGPMHEWCSRAMTVKAWTSR
ncbi:hypothetical protein ACV35W_33995, partial [Pseudomonas aeruginosa]